MKKIIAAFDGLRFSESTKDYVVEIAKQNGAHLVGIFLDDYTHHSYSYADVASFGSKWEEKMHVLDEKDTETRKIATSIFEKACQRAGINYSVHHDKNIALNDLIHETIYSDLLVIAGNETFTYYNGSKPTSFIRDLLAETQCPVIITPYSFNTIEKIIFLYDGTPSSVYAVKMFDYTMPAFKYLDVEVISVKDEQETLHVPDGKLMKEFMKRHFPDARYTVIKGEPKEKILDYLRLQNENVLVALGAYERGRVSRWFKKSMADDILANINVPLFIAHCKS